MTARPALPIAMVEAVETAILLGGRREDVARRAIAAVFKVMAEVGDDWEPAQEDKVAVAKALCRAHCGQPCPYGNDECETAKLWAFMMPDAEMAMRLLRDRGWTPRSDPA